MRVFKDNLSPRKKKDNQFKNVPNYTILKNQDINFISEKNNFSSMLD